MSFSDKRVSYGFLMRLLIGPTVNLTVGRSDMSKFTEESLARGV